MKLEEIIPYISAAYQIGYMEAVKSYEPCQDCIKKTEVLKWLKAMRFNRKHFDYLLKNGYIKPFRKGTGKNSPFYYSKVEIKKAMSVIKVTNDIVSQNI